MTVKKIYSTAVSLWLSVLLVWTGAGIALMHCCHSGHTGAVQVQQVQAGAGHSRCCCAKAPCMTVRVLKLSPSVPPVTVTRPLLPVTFLPALFHTAPPACVPVLHGLPVQKPRGRAWHGPPRSWLAFIRVLVI